MDNPSPVPDDLVVKFGVNIFFCNDSGIPDPLSDIPTTTVPSCFSRVTFIIPSLPEGIDWMLFLMRLENILLICSLSA